MVRTFLCTSLFLLLTTSCVVFSAPIQLTDVDDSNNDQSLIDNDLDEYINSDTEYSNTIDDKLSDLSISTQMRVDSYKKVLTFVKTLQDNIDKEHTDLTRIFGAETKEHNDRKKELNNVRLSVENLRRSLQNTQWKVGNLTNNITSTGNEHSKILDTIEFHNQVLKEELDNVNKFYVESNKYKNYKEFSEIKTQIDELKNAVHKETGDVIDIYSKLANRLSNNLISKKKKLLFLKEQEKIFNGSLTLEGNSYNNLFNSFQTFLNNYQKNTKQYKEATESYIEERELLQKLSNFLQNTNPEKCLKVQQDYNELLNSQNVKTKANEQLLNELNSLKKKIDDLTLSLNKCNNKLSDCKQSLLQTSTINKTKYSGKTILKVTTNPLTTPKPQQKKN